MDHIEFHRLHAAQKPLQPVKVETASDIQSRSGLPWLPLKLSFWMPHGEMLREAEALRECFVPHRSYNESNKGWHSLTIHGLSSVHTGPRERYKTLLPYRWTDICDFCPVTHAFFRDLFGYRSYYRIRFMLLEPGGYILPHRDSATDRLDAINVALNNPAGCDFVMEDCGIVPFQPGTAIMLSLSKQHIVWNQSNQDRYHIIVHGERDPAVWDEIVVNSYHDCIRHMGPDQSHQ